MKRFFEKRIDKIKAGFDERSALFVSNSKDVTYLTGFTGDNSYLFITKDRTVFITDGRFTEQMEMEVLINTELAEIVPGRKIFDILLDLLSDFQIQTVLCDKKDINLDFYENLNPGLLKLGLNFIHTDLVKNSRLIKDELEIEIIRQNLIITELGYHYIIRLIEGNKKESDIAAELEYYLKKQGAEKMSFDSIIASGFRSALPHGAASAKTIQNEEIVLMDFGIEKDKYCSDFTRCFYFGDSIDPKIVEIRNVVNNALIAAEELIRPGILAKQVHLAAFEVIEKAGYAQLFKHSTGHGVGLDIHEAPWINSTSDTELKEGMVFTIEPGIYMSGLGGIRLEDMVIVRKNGCEDLTKASYNL